MAKTSKRKRLKKVAGVAPWKFLLFQFVLPTTDIVTDTLTGYNYHKQGHKLWAREAIIYRHHGVLECRIGTQ